mmetsp:Transcript_13393/g.34254  ORF Transcript_13393/g.34254 Transcript_13393/m.34254 type:complete len:203 (+) Transcript_13393:1069-1677(+)
MGGGGRRGSGGWDGGSCGGNVGGNCSRSPRQLLLHHDIRKAIDGRGEIDRHSAEARGEAKSGGRRDISIQALRDAIEEEALCHRVGCRDEIRGHERRLEATKLGLDDGQGHRCRAIRTLDVADDSRHDRHIGSSLHRLDDVDEVGGQADIRRDALYRAHRRAHAVQVVNDLRQLSGNVLHGTLQSGHTVQDARNFIADHIAD